MKSLINLGDNESVAGVASNLRGRLSEFFRRMVSINNLFRGGRHRMRAVHYPVFRERAFVTWQDVAGLPRVA